jgi:hypothetical protein
MSNEIDTQGMIDRREAVKRVSALLGGFALFGSDRLVRGLERFPLKAGEGIEGMFTAAEIAFLDEVADTILPTTDRSPGAKAAQTGAFMAVMVADTYAEREQQIFKAGMKTLDEGCTKMHGHGFMMASAAERTAFLTALDKEAHDTRPNGTGPHYFRLMKELTLLGYFTSEIGYTKAMRYVETPGRYDPCVPYKAGDKAWASHA